MYQKSGGDVGSSALQRERRRTFSCAGDPIQVQYKKEVKPRAGFEFRGSGSKTVERSSGKNSRDNFIRGPPARSDAQFQPQFQARIQETTSPIGQFQSRLWGIEPPPVVPTNFTLPLTALTSSSWVRLRVVSMCHWRAIRTNRTSDVNQLPGDFQLWVLLAPRVASPYLTLLFGDITVTCK
ncbi:hypothetical protein FA13DRAFT_1711299 [Coprinellus micaceus]|uniref:Uncharacterized protein n=1 Tax=Coprinellus micaceus TaxID=71717 RepID=A0A4Y7T5F4_COPMI|nr:hypothetical protein FA13DRAFT_1711299 [Coprinellus micaceus]